MSDSTEKKDTKEAFIASAHSVSGAEHYAQTIRVGHHTLIADEPTLLGGQDKGAAPYGLLMSSLASCTAITFKMYADRKKWDLGEVKVDLAMYRDADGTERVARKISIEKPLTEEQHARLLEIANKTPVTKTLLRTLKIDTSIAP